MNNKNNSLNWEKTFQGNNGVTETNPLWHGADSASLPFWHIPPLWVSSLITMGLLHSTLLSSQDGFTAIGI